MERQTPPPPPGAGHRPPSGDAASDWKERQQRPPREEPEEFSFSDAYDRQSRTWGMLCHLSALSTYVGVPFGNLAGPLLVWLLKRKEFPFVDEQGKEALNFQLSMTLYFILAALLIVVLVGFFLLLALAVFHVIAVIVAAVRANEGRSFRYPLTVRFLR